MAGIYIHIPFCKKFCIYCDFYKIISPDNKDPFIKALLKEAEIRQNYLQGEIISTIYFGGGTPSVLPVSDVHTIVGELDRIYKIDENCEFTIEINPEDADLSYLQDLRKTGVNRISLGIQSWKNEDLIILNRRHDSAKAEKALENVIKSGFNNISIDLIYGLPGMSVNDLEANLNKTLQYDIKHISAYHLTVEPGTVLEKMKKEGLINEPDEEEIINQYNTLIDKTGRAGFIQYEISNFGKENYFSRHNVNYWKQVNYIGLGPSAHSFNGYSRQWNIRDVERYINSVDNDDTFFEKEELDTKKRFNEYIMVSLRTMWGIDLDYVEKVFAKEGYDYIINLANKFRDYGLMKQDKKNLVLTNQGKMISDNIISEFMMVDKT
jgi:oxygen-independent coproporphyrinogen-3 oxidase